MAFRLVDIQADIIGTGGSNPLNGITTRYDNEPYLTRLFDDRNNESGGFTGNYTYTFMMTSSLNACLSPYQEAASGSNNEKYNADYNNCFLKIYSGTYLLPVNMLSFTAAKQGEYSYITWETSQEINTHHFEIEHSKNGIDFEKIGEVAGAGNSDIVQKYSFLHRTPVTGMNYYRLKQVDLDGKTKYTELRSVKFNTINSFTVYPNPTTDKVYINAEVKNATLDVSVITVDGKQIQHYANFHSGNSIDLSAFPNEVYFIKIIESNGTVRLKKIIKK